MECVKKIWRETKICDRGPKLGQTRLLYETPALWDFDQLESQSPGRKEQNLIFVIVRRF